MKNFKNGDVALVGLQPYFDEYALVKYVDYSCYFPWLSKNCDIIFPYRFTTSDPFDKEIPCTNDLELLSNPIALKYYGVPQNIRFIRNNPPKFSETLPSLFFKRNRQFCDRLLKEKPGLVEKPEFVFLFSTKFGLYSYSEVSYEDYDYIEFEETYLTCEINYRIALDLTIERGESIERIYSLSKPSELETVERVLALKCMEKMEKHSNTDISHLFYLPDEKREKYAPYLIDENYLTFNFQLFLSEFSEIFEKKGLVANYFGWILLFDYLSKDRRLYDFEYDESNYILTREEDVRTLAQLIENAVSNPEFVDATLAQIPTSLREKYFPSSSICQDLAAVEINFKELNTPSEFFKILRVTEGKKTRYNIILQVEDLFGIYYTLFEKYGTIANGYGWESLIIQEFMPQKIDDDLDTMVPILDPEAAGFTISFRKKKDCLALGEKLCIFLQEKERVTQALERLVDDDDIVSSSF